MPDADSLVFWRSLAQRYANRPGVADWNGTPIAGQGVLIKQAMLAAAP